MRRFRADDKWIAVAGVCSSVEEIETILTMFSSSSYSIGLASLAPMSMAVVFTSKTYQWIGGQCTGMYVTIDPGKKCLLTRCIVHNRLGRLLHHC
jgi:hypothetical protein